MESITENVVERRRYWSLFSFIAELKRELKRVSWISGLELKKATKAVIFSTFVFGFGIYLIDLMIKAFLTMLGFLFRRISG
jgi:preprotein translocase SecE subunit